MLCSINNYIKTTGLHASVSGLDGFSCPTHDQEIENINYVQCWNTFTSMVVVIRSLPTLTQLQDKYAMILMYFLDMLHTKIVICWGNITKSDCISMLFTHINNCFVCFANFKEVGPLG